MRLRYGYDRASNRLWREDLVAQSYSKDFDEIYAYDGLQRLRDMQRGRLNGTQTALTTQSFGQCWNLDATGNWTGFKETDNGSTWTLEQSRTANTVNEITAITNTTGEPWSQPRYDKAGNMTTLRGPAITGLDWTTLSTDEWSALTTDEWADLPASHTKDATYDAWNRLIKLTDGPTGHTIQENQYDARTFRTIRKDYEEGTLSETRHFYYSPDWRCVEERIDASPDADRQFVWGLRYIDELICRDRDTDSDGDLDERLYACQDANWNVVAVVTNDGVAQSRFGYSSYGAALRLADDFSEEISSPFSWETLYGGYRYDKQSQLFLIRNRFYSAQTGTWLSRDPAEYIASPNLFEYTISRPTILIDPYGLEPPGYHHPYPLFLGGSNSQPLFYLNQQAHTAAHHSLQRSLGARSGDAAREAFRRLSESQQHEVLRQAMRAGGIPDELINQYWDDIIRDADPRIRATTRGYQRGIRIGGPRATTGVGSTIARGASVGLGFFLLLDGIGRTASAEESRRNCLMRCRITRIVVQETAPTGVGAFIYETEVAFHEAESFEANVYSNDIDELRSLSFNESTVWSHSGFEERQWESYRVDSCERAE